MSEWRKERSRIHDDWALVHGDGVDVRVIASHLTESDADQIIREHNAMPELVQIAKSHRGCLSERMGTGFKSREKYLKIREALDAVLARAEGRE